MTRPFEFVVLCAVVLLFFVPARALVIAALTLAPAIGLTLLQNKQVTGSWTQLPYQLSRYQYGVPTTFTFQPNPVPHRPLSVEQQVDYEAQVAVHGKDTDTSEVISRGWASAFASTDSFFSPRSISRWRRSYRR